MYLYKVFSCVSLSLLYGLIECNWTESTVIKLLWQWSVESWWYTGACVLERVTAPALARATHVLCPGRRTRERTWRRAACLALPDSETQPRERKRETVKSRLLFVCQMSDFIWMRARVCVFSWCVRALRVQLRSKLLSLALRSDQ